MKTPVPRFFIKGGEGEGGGESYPSLMVSPSHSSLTLSLVSIEKPTTMKSWLKIKMNVHTR
jgi:hypothetical protein